MTTQRRITRPGMHDNEFMTVTCTPEETAVEFFEFQPEAEDAARENLHPTTTTYVGKVLKQGEHATRGTAKHIAILVEVDDELASALQKWAGAKRRLSRLDLVGRVRCMLDIELRKVLQAHRSIAGRDDEVTHPGVVPPQAATPTELIRRLAQPAIDRAHQAIDMAAAKAQPDLDWSRLGIEAPVCSCHSSDCPRCSAGESVDRRLAVDVNVDGFGHRTVRRPPGEKP